MDHSSPLKYGASCKNGMTVIITITMIMMII